MSPCLCIVLALAVAVSPTPSPDFDRLERRMQELVEQEHFEELAREGEAAFGRVDLPPWQRRALAFYALRGLHRVSEASGRPGPLCQARALHRRVEREVGLAEDAVTATRLHEVTEHRLTALGLKDPCPVALRPRLGPMTPPAQLLPVDRPAAISQRSAEVDTQPVLIDISRGTAPRTKRPPRPTFSAHTDPPIAPTPLAPESRPRRRTIGGGVLLGLGAGFIAGMTAALVSRSKANAIIIGIVEHTEAAYVRPTEAEVNRALAAGRDYQQLTAVAGITGASAAALTVAGIALLAAPQQGKRTTATLSATPWSATLTLAGRF